MDQFIKNNCINSKPDINLKACLSQYDKSRLVDLANKQHLLLNMGAPIHLEKLNKNQVIQSLFTQIYTHFETDLFYLPPEEIAFFNRLMAADFEAIEDLNQLACHFLQSLGYIYLYNYKGNIYPIIPKEIRSIYHQIPKNELEEEMNLNNSLYAYAIALTHIHGIYTPEYFVEVWNEYNTRKIDYDDATTYFDMMYDRQNYFSFDYQYVVTHYPSNEYGYNLLDLNNDKPYPIPTQAQIQFYSKQSLGEHSPYYARLS